MYSVLRAFTGATCITLAACNAGNAQDPGYGSPQMIEWTFPQGELGIRITPWEEIENVEIPDWAMQHRLSVAAGEKVLDQQHKILESTIDDAWYIARDLRRKRGKKRFSILTACTYKGKGEHGRMVDAYGNIDILLQDGDAMTPQLTELIEEVCEERPSTARDNAILAEILTEPGKGAQPSRITKVLVGSNQYWDGSFLAVDKVVNVLFKDGWAYQDPSVPVSDLDVARSRELQPGKWHKWRKRGKKYQTMDPTVKDDEWSEVEFVWQIKPARRGAHFNGHYDYSSVSGSIYHGSFISRGSYSLNADGTYTSSTSSQFGGNTATADLGSINMFSSCNDKGGSTQVSGTAPGVVMSTRKANQNCGDGKAGTYNVRNYTIELQANNGVTRRLPFYELDKNWLIIGWQDYRVDED